MPSQTPAAGCHSGIPNGNGMSACRLSPRVIVQQAAGQMSYKLWDIQQAEVVDFGSRTLSGVLDQVPGFEAT